MVIDLRRCVGCGNCIRLCPYGVRSFNPSKKATGEPTEHPADKCTFCEHRVAEGVVPSCVNTCLAGARVFGDLEDKDSNISKLLTQNTHEVLLPEKNTKPHVFYIGKDGKLLNEAYRNGRDLRKEAGSDYQIQVWKQGPHAPKNSLSIVI